MKKNIYLFAILTTLILVSCGSGSNNNPDPNTFSFENLKLDLDSVKKIGVYQNNDAKLLEDFVNTQITNRTLYSYLIGYDSADQIVPLKYLDSTQKEVQIPFSALSLEVQEEFSYVVYFNQSYGYPNIDVNRINNPDELLFSRLIKSSNNYRFVIIHNASGTLYDAKGWGHNGLDNIIFFEAMVNKIIFFTYGQERGSCRFESIFDITSKDFIKSETVCTPLEISPFYIHSDGGFIYYLGIDGSINYASNDFSETRVLTNAPHQRTYKSIGENVVGFTPKKFIVFNSNFEVLEEAIIESEYEAWTGRSVSWIYKKNNIDYFNINGGLVGINYTTLNYLSYPLGGETFLMYEKNLFIFSGSNIRGLDDLNNPILLASNISGIKNDFSEILRTGYVEYFEISGLTQINKYLNLQTGEIYLQSESRPTITVTQVQPIN